MNYDSWKAYNPADEFLGPCSGPLDPEDHIEFEDREQVRAMGRMMDDEPEHKPCPQCGGEPVLLGQLGNIIHLRCRDCGWDFTL